MNQLIHVSSTGLQSTGTVVPDLHVEHGDAREPGHPLKPAALSLSSLLVREWDRALASPALLYRLTTELRAGSFSGGLVAPLWAAEGTEHGLEMP